MEQRTSLERLHPLLQQESPLSHRRISELRDRVAAGDFLTRQAAEATASRMLDESFDLDPLLP